MNLGTSTFPERLRTARILNGLSQTQLAKKMGRQSLAISRWERGKTSPTPSSAAMLASTLNISIRWLLVGEGAMEMNSQTTKGPVAARPSSLTILTQ